MEKAIFPLNYMYQTQGVNGDFSHQGSLAIDYGHRGAKEKIRAPFTGIIRKISPNNGNCVWLESVDKVLWANGIIDYVTMLFMHDDDVSDLHVGQVIKQGEYFYAQGTAGWATGIHVHIEIGKGKFHGLGWFTNNQGRFMINDAVHPVDVLFLTEDIDIVNNGGYNWRMLIGDPVIRNIEVDQIEVLADDLRCREEPNGNILGFINRGTYNILEMVDKEDYKWIKIKENRWIAYSDEWSNLFIVNNENLLSKVKELENEILILKKQIETYNNFKFKYEVLKTANYSIKLYENEILYIIK